MSTNTANPANAYCEVLGIQQPSLEGVRDHPAANTYALFIVALLERGAPMTLEQAARRFEEAGMAPAYRALESLQRCKPGRPLSTAMAPSTLSILTTRKRTCGHFGLV